MFDKSKFNKIKNSQSQDYCLISVSYSLAVDKKAQKDFLKFLSKNFGNYNIETANDIATAKAYCVAEKLEEIMNELSETIVSLKTSETIKFTVNDSEFEF